MASTATKSCTNITHQVKQASIRLRGSCQDWNTERQTRQISRHRSIFFHLYTIWLFTFSDLKTIVGPSVAFAISNGLASHALGIDPPPSSFEVFKRIPIVLLWVWINLLPFTIDNQRQPDAFEEDAMNKPWRPMPSKRLTASQAKVIMIVSYAAAFLTSLLFGSLKQCVALMALGFFYNNVGGADASCIVRNFVNACGFICFLSGCLEVALQRDVFASLSTPTAQWLLVIAAIVFTTVQVQDLYDQAGDALRDRKTAPLVIGDIPARWTVALAMAFWCFFCPWSWNLTLPCYLPSVSLGLTIATRTLSKRTVSADKVTFRIWNLWLVALYLLPMMKMIGQ